MSLVKALSSAVFLVESYFTEKEIIRKKSEKKKRGEQKRTEYAPVVPLCMCIEGIHKK